MEGETIMIKKKRSQGRICRRDSVQGDIGLFQVIHPFCLPFMHCASRPLPQIVREWFGNVKNDQTWNGDGLYIFVKIQLQTFSPGRHF
ncbi:MAG: hypothetical protein D4R73_05425 [Deltaproteobacteria bacterium]|nr:MAG: hypothetical protein D4R73_05425 [Deltaproteobacteria bacterium]